MTHQGPHPRLGTTLAGKYLLTALLGAGGMGDVYAARNTWTGREVALKLLQPRAHEPAVLARFFREARIGSTLDHPNIVRVYDLGRAEDGAWFIVQELLRGESLDHRLAEQGPLAPALALELLVPIASALVATHARGVVHRDLKPANIFLRHSPGGWTPVLIDFGISKIIPRNERDAQQLAELTLAGDFLGTPAYMSPEQVEGEPDLGPQADVWSLGAVLYRTLTGRPPFTGTLTAILEQIARRDADPLRLHAPSASAALETAVARALQRDRRARFADMATMLRALLDTPELADHPELRQRYQPATPTELTTIPDLGVVASDLALDGQAPAFADAEHAIAALTAGSTLLNASGESSRGPAPSSAAGPQGSPSRRPRGLLLLAALLLAVTLAGILFLILRDPDAPAPDADEPARAGLTVTATAEAASAATTQQQARGSIAAELCRAWAPRLLEQQLEDGAFAGIIHLPPTGWASAQSLAALSAARAGCPAGTVPEERFVAADTALDRFSRERGWGEFDHGEETIAAAWVALAARDTSRGPDSERQDAALARLRRARALVLGAQRPDGGFADRTDPGSDGYQSVMATWALVEAERTEPHPPSAPPRGRALAWLRQELDRALTHGEGELSSATGLIAMAGMVLALSRQTDPHDAGDVQRLEAVVARLSLDCDFEPGSGCRRALNQNDRDRAHPPNDHRTGIITILWAPWTLLAVDAMQRDTTLPLSEPTRARLAALADWGLQAMSRESAILGNENGFVLSEWLFLSARLAGR